MIMISSSISSLLDRHKISVSCTVWTDWYQGPVHVEKLQGCLQAQIVNYFPYFCSGALFAIRSDCGILLSTGQEVYAEGRAPQAVDIKISSYFLKTFFVIFSQLITSVPFRNTRVPSQFKKSHDKMLTGGIGQALYWWGRGWACWGDVRLRFPLRRWWGPGWCVLRLSSHICRDRIVILWI